MYTYYNTLLPFLQSIRMMEWREISQNVKVAPSPHPTTPPLASRTAAADCFSTRQDRTVCAPSLTMYTRSVPLFPPSSSVSLLPLPSRVATAAPPPFGSRVVLAPLEGISTPPLRPVLFFPSSLNTHLPLTFSHRWLFSLSTTHPPTHRHLLAQLPTHNPHTPNPPCRSS